MGTPIAGKGHTSPLTGMEKVPLSPDGYATTDEIAALGTGGGLTTLIANDEDITIPDTGGTFVVLFTAVTAPRVVNLPPASSPATRVVIKDVNAQSTLTNTLTFVPDGTDTVALAFGAIGVNLIGYGLVQSVSNDEVSAWIDTSAPSQADNQTYGSLIDFAATQLAVNKATYWTAEGEQEGGGADSTLSTWTAVDGVVTKDQFKGMVSFSAPRVFTMPEISIAYWVRAVIFTDDTCDETNTLTITGDSGVTIVGGDVLVTSAAQIELHGQGTTWWVINRHLHDGESGLFARDVPTSDPNVVDQVWDNGDGILRRSHG